MGHLTGGLAHEGLPPPKQGMPANVSGPRHRSRPAPLRIVDGEAEREPPASAEREAIRMREFYWVRVKGEDA